MSAVFANTSNPSSTDVLDRYTLPLAVFGYSIELPFLANTGTGQKAVAGQWNDPAVYDRDLLRWLSAPNPVTMAQLFNLTPTDPTELVNTNLRAIFEASITFSA